jgi:hypothetical protein
MRSDDLAKQLAPFRLVASRTAHSPEFRAIELAPDHVTACASFGLISAAIEIGITDTVYADASVFLATIRSLPHDKPVVLSSEGGVLSWTCGQARGRLALLPKPDMPSVPDFSPGIEPTPTTGELARALDLGSVSCDEAMQAIANTYGVVLDNRNGTTAYSTDNTTLSAYDLGDMFYDVPPLVPLPPHGAALLAGVIEDGGLIEINSNTVIYHDEHTSCAVRQIKPLSVDIGSLRQQYADLDAITAIPRDQINTFIRRVTALTESRHDARVAVGVTDGKVTLDFSEGSIASDEYFELSDELQGFPDMPPISVPAVKMARALNDCNEIALNHLDRGVIALRGGPFCYLVSGRF